MELRNKIIGIIYENCPELRYGDVNLAAKEILKHLDGLLSLDGNGWFDNDKEMSEFLEE
ncbi:hypothetical protein LCGC14_1078710 [marine sediment metagenome]|uniref:Uncharacterized protein n=1 Tax=marine sediment metagenome TaxID=412755 RepID=A0A0F9N3L6_9ZZZZ